MIAACGAVAWAGAVLQALVGRPVACAAQCHPDGPGTLDAREARFVRGASARRVADFATGRRCARSALLKLGLTPESILVGPYREPVWPEGIVGSITHCPGFYAAALAHRRDLRSIGIDAECGN